MNPTSIKDIAKAAGVSSSTVSRALQGSPLISKATAERIRRIANKAGYLPSAVGRSLVTRKTNTIGVVVTTISDPMMADVVSGIETAANESGYSVFLAHSYAKAEREMQVVQSFLERRVDGVLVLASRVGAQYKALFAHIQVPLILINNQYPEPFEYSVGIDNVPASRAITQYLIRLGHRRIAYIGDRLGRETDVERFNGYRQALKSAGIPPHQELVAAGDGRIEAGVEAMRQLLDLPSPPTAVVCYNDMTAIGALRAARTRSIPVPAEISLTGFDDLFISTDTNPPLTTIRQPKRRMGQLAIAMLMKILAGEECERHIKVQGELIVRESAAPPPQAR